MLLAFILGGMIGAMSLGILIFSGQIDSFITDGQCKDQSIQYYNQAIIDVANFTTLTGNFTYILDGSIRTQGVQEYCVSIIQNLNDNQEVK